MRLVAEVWLTYLKEWIFSLTKHTTSVDKWNSCLCQRVIRIQFNGNANYLLTEYLKEVEYHWLQRLRNFWEKWTFYFQKITEYKRNLLCLSKDWEKVIGSLSVIIQLEINWIADTDISINIKYLTTLNSPLMFLHSFHKKLNLHYKFRIINFR